MFKRKSKKFIKKVTGFTIVEMLVCITIFSIISVLMTNILLETSRFSLDSERRNDILTELDNAANVIKNGLRGSSRIGICQSRGTPAYVYRLTNGTYYKLAIDGASGVNKLVWFSTDSTCTATGSDPTGVTSGEIMQVKNLRVANSIDIPNNPKNSLIYIAMEVCDLNNVPANRRIFDCTSNPYSYFFAISTRSVQ